ncbi:MAG: ABC transporter permease subunit [Planctomycetota bacterium]
MSEPLSRLIEFVIQTLFLIHPLVLIVILGILAYFRNRSILRALGIMLSFTLIWNLGYWEATLQTLALIALASGISLSIGIPFGIWCARHPILYRAVRLILDLMQTIPTFVYLIPTLMLFGLGVVPGLVSTIIFAIPAPIRLTHLGIHSVPKELIEAGKAFGASPFQILWKIEIPYALPSIMEGISQCIMLSLSMVVIATLVGAEGLGTNVVRALGTVNIAQGFEAGLAIVIVAISFDRLLKKKNPFGQEKK